MANLSEGRTRELQLQIGEVFTPSAPIDDLDLFAGRNHELFSVIEATQSAGQHCVIYGERGVGKTSLARTAASTVEHQGQLAVRINCDATDTFDSLWIKVIDEANILWSEMSEGKAAFGSAFETLNRVLTAGTNNPGTVRVGLRAVTALSPLVIFFDEFNEIQDSNTIIALSNTIKTLSDAIERVTLCPVGVALNLDSLLEGHQSAIRAIVQVKMPRMVRQELSDIVTRGLDKLEMSIEDDARALIEVVPRGLPSYAHLLAQEASRQALIREDSHITRDDVINGLDVGLKKLDRSLSRAYDDGTYSPKRTRFKEVLLACAMAQRGDSGDFSPSDVRTPYSRIIGENVGVDRVNPQLTALTTRGILDREGEPRRWRYRFSEPLMEPYVLMLGLKSGLVNPDDFPT